MADEKTRENRREPRPAKGFLTSFYRTGHSSQFILAVLALIGWFGFASVERMTRKTLADTLQMTLNANAQALRDWLKTKKDEVTGWASYRDSRQEILQLLELAKHDSSRETLLGSRELARLRARLGPVCRSHDFTGFVIFDKTGLQVGALFDGPVGERDLVEKSDFVARSLRGETVVSVPFLDNPWAGEDFTEADFKPASTPSGVTPESAVATEIPPAPFARGSGPPPPRKRAAALAPGPARRQVASAAPAPIGSAQMANERHRGQSGLGHPPLRQGATMFVSTPVAGDDGQIAGVFAFRVKPEADFSKIFTTSRWGETGETYAFDANGLLLTDSRFNHHLQAIGLIPSRPESPAILTVEIRDPGGNMVEGFRPAVPRGWQPLTKMAASAVKGESGLDVDGYRDYRGVPVIGAWRWIPECEFGVATEIDSDEAFAALRFLRALFLSTFGLLTVATLFFISSKARHMELRRRNALILNSAAEGIYGVDTEGRATFINPSAAQMIGRQPAEALGQRLHDVLHHARANGTLYPVEQCPIYAAFKDGKVHHSADEVFWRKDGTCFPVEYTSTPIIEDGKPTGAVVTFKDITERKRAEENLKKEATYVRLLREIAVAANEAQSIESAIQVALDRICQIIGWPLGHFHLVSADGKRLVPTNLWHVSDPARYDAFIRITNRTKFVSGEGLPGRILAGGKPEWIRDVTQDGNFPRASVPLNVPLDPTPPPADAEAEGLSPLQRGPGGFPPPNVPLDPMPPPACAAAEGPPLAQGAEEIPTGQTPGGDAAMTLRDRRNAVPASASAGGGIGSRPSLAQHGERRETIDIGVRGAFGFPVVADKEIVGVLEFFSPEVIERDDRFLEVMANMGAQLGRVAERKRAEANLMEAWERLELRVKERTAELQDVNENLEREIAARKRVEERLTVSLKEKEILLREIHHRTKNNIQVIASLLRLHGREIQEEKYQAIIREACNRVVAMGMVHDKIFQAKNLARIDFQEYAASLGRSLFQSFGGKAESVDLRIDTHGVSLGVDACIHCGLIINELISNSLKHAFPEGRKGEIRVELERLENQNLLLTVRDNGVGIPSFKFRGVRFTGLNVVATLAETQMKGAMKLYNNQGAVFELQFKQGESHEAA
ncbi:MAG: PAS domain S-box protein [Nitrospinae bacterium]|nr:PAS domain S-box protein [Nitrospinota bacterium]